MLRGGREGQGGRRGQSLFPAGVSGIIPLIIPGGWPPPRVIPSPRPAAAAADAAATAAAACVAATPLRCQLVAVITDPRQPHLQKRAIRTTSNRPQHRVRITCLSSATQNVPKYGNTSTLVPRSSFIRGKPLKPCQVRRYRNAESASAGVL